MPNEWTSRLQDRYKVTFPPDLASWFDDEVYEADSDGQFNQPVEASDLLDPTSPVVWSGQMLPDTIPLLGDGAGNELCARLTPDGTIGEYIAWDHEGYAWTSCGATLAEALVYDALAVEDEAVENDRPRTRDTEEFSYAAWAVARIPGLEGESPADFLTNAREGRDTLFRLGLLHEPILRDRCANACLSPYAKFLRSGKGDVLAEFRRIVTDAGREAPRTWGYDLSSMPQEYRDRLAAAAKMPFDQLAYVDWDEAAALAKAAISERTDLAWPYAVAGRAAERAGRIDEAIQMYRNGVENLETSAAFTKNWSRPPAYRLKFVLERLVDLRDQFPELKSDPLVAAGAQFRISDYWLECADAAEKANDWPKAYEYLYRAGWDEAIFDYTSMVVDRLAIAAGHFSPCLEAVAAHHYASRTR